MLEATRVGGAPSGLPEAPRLDDHWTLAVPRLYLPPCESQFNCLINKDKIVIL